MDSTWIPHGTIIGKMIITLELLNDDHVSKNLSHLFNDAIKNLYLKVEACSRLTAFVILYLCQRYSHVESTWIPRGFHMDST